MLAIENVLSTAPAKQARVAKTLHDYIFFFSYSRRHNHIKPTTQIHGTHSPSSSNKKRKKGGIKEVQLTFPSAVFHCYMWFPGYSVKHLFLCRINAVITNQSHGDIKTITRLFVTCFISQFPVPLRRVTAEGSEPVLGTRVKHSTDSSGIMRWCSKHQQRKLFWEYIIRRCIISSRTQVLKSPYGEICRIAVEMSQRAPTPPW